MQQHGSAILDRSGGVAIASPSAPIGWRHLLLLALLVSASVAFSLGFACATPLAAFATVAALTLSRRDALALILSVWLANQLVGFMVLGYPWTANTFAWGVALGAAVVLATFAGRWTAGRLAAAGRVVSFAFTFLIAFAVYEAALFAVAALLLGGTEDFTAAILGRIFAINAAAFAGLIIVHRFGASLGFSSTPIVALSVRERRV